VKEGVEEAMRRLSKGIVVLFACIGVVATAQQLVGQSPAPLADSNFTHIGIVTPDIEKTMQMFVDVYGIAAPTNVRIYDNNGRGMPFPPGVAGNKDARAKLVQFSVGTARIELIEPVGGPTAWSEHLQKYGQSVHHLAFQAKDSSGALRGLQNVGGKWVMGEGGNAFAYVDMKDQLGFTIEVNRQQPAAPAQAAPAPVAPAR
jgi:hypothetical protein